MPKSGRSRGKSFQKAKARRSVPVERIERQTAAMPQQTVTPMMGTTAPVRRPTTVSHSLGVKASSMAVVYPYIRGEIKKICILSGILIAILVVLVLVWP